MATNEHSGIRAHLEAQWRELRNGDYIRDLGESLRGHIYENAPVDLGILRRNAATLTPIRETSDGFEIGVGDKARVGQATGAPRGTIASFLRDYPQFRRRWSSIVSPRYAWWKLPKAAKELLQEGRLGGLYGGWEQGVGIGQSAYLYPQEGSLPEWSVSAQKAAINPTGFISASLNIWREADVPRIIRRFMSRMAEL